MAEEKTRVDFNAPKSLVERADSVVEILDISRTRLLIDALEDELADLANDEEFRRRLGDAYYDGRVDYETVEAILGREHALRTKLLRASVDRTPAEPQPEEGLPSDDAFYDGNIPESFRPNTSTQHSPTTSRPKAGTGSTWPGCATSISESDTVGYNFVSDSATTG